MGELSGLADSIEATFGLILPTVSGGNSGNLDWVLSGADTERVNDLRLGESLLLGREPLHRHAHRGTPHRRHHAGRRGHRVGLQAIPAVGRHRPERVRADRPDTSGNGSTQQAVLAIGEQDTDCGALVAPAGFEITGASSDHLVLDCGSSLPPVGAEVRFELGYSALVRAMTSPFVSQVTMSRGRSVAGTSEPDGARGRCIASRGSAADHDHPAYACGISHGVSGCG